jgi:uncharacterized protein (DUF4415 family)
MRNSKNKPPHVSQADWDAVASPPLSATQLKKMRPAKEAAPDLVAAYRRSRGRPKSVQPKMLVSLRLDADVIDAFKAVGPGWQTRINAVLSNWAKGRTKAATKDRS